MEDRSHHTGYNVAGYFTPTDFETKENDEPEDKSGMSSQMSHHTDQSLAWDAQRNQNQRLSIIYNRRISLANEGKTATPEQHRMGSLSRPRISITDELGELKESSSRSSSSAGSAMMIPAITIAQVLKSIRYERTLALLEFKLF